MTCPSSHNSKGQFGSYAFKTVNRNLSGEAFTLRKLKGCLKIFQYRDSTKDWRDSCEIKMNNLEFSQLLTNLKILSEI